MQRAHSKSTTRHASSNASKADKHDKRGTSAAKLLSTRPTLYPDLHLESHAEEIRKRPPPTNPESELEPRPSAPPLKAKAKKAPVSKDTAIQSEPTEYLKADPCRLKIVKCSKKIDCDIRNIQEDDIDSVSAKLFGMNPWASYIRGVPEDIHVRRVLKADCNFRATLTGIEVKEGAGVLFYLYNVDQWNQLEVLIDDAKKRGLQLDFPVKFMGRMIGKDDLQFIQYSTPKIDYWIPAGELKITPHTFTKTNLVWIQHTDYSKNYKLCKLTKHVEIKLNRFLVEHKDKEIGFNTRALINDTLTLENFDTVLNITDPICRLLSQGHN